MDWKLEVVVVPISDVDRAKHFYADQIWFSRRCGHAYRRTRDGGAAWRTVELVHLLQ